MSGWQTVDLRGRPATFAAPAVPRFGLVYLPSLVGESLADEPAFAAPFLERGFAIVCPTADEPWWLGPAARRYFLEGVLPYFAQWGLGARSVGLVGVSAGGQAVLRFAFEYPETFPVVVAVSPVIEVEEFYGRGTPLDELYASKEYCRQDTVPMHVHPSKQPPHVFFAMDPGDPYFRGCERLHEKLGALGVQHTADLTTAGGGHSWEYFERQAARAAEFLWTGLESESRRLL